MKKNNVTRDYLEEISNRKAMQEVNEKYNGIIEELVERYAKELKGLRSDYRIIGESDTEQATRWNYDTKERELLWQDEEHTIPQMAKVWGDVEMTEEEWNSDDNEYKRTEAKALEMLLDDVMGLLK